MIVKVPLKANHEALKTALFLAIAVLGNSFGNLLLSIGMGHMPDYSPNIFARYLFLLATNPYLIAGEALSAIYAISQLSLFSWADLSFVVPCIASSYVVTTLLSQFVANEHVGITNWIGVLLICAGVALVAATPARTIPHGGKAKP